jgi:hypothetical protein
LQCFSCGVKNGGINFLELEPIHLTAKSTSRPGVIAPRGTYNLPYKFLISLLIRRTHIGGRFELGCLIGLVKHANWAFLLLLLHLLYQPLLSISEALASFQLIP